jgi:hypothetical protein
VHRIFCDESRAALFSVASADLSREFVPTAAAAGGLCTDSFPMSAAPRHYEPRPQIRAASSCQRVSRRATMNRIRANMPRGAPL